MLEPGIDGNALAIWDVPWQAYAILLHLVESWRYQDLLNPFRARPDPEP